MKKSQEKKVGGGVGWGWGVRLVEWDLDCIPKSMQYWAVSRISAWLQSSHRPRKREDLVHWKLLVNCGLRLDQLIMMCFIIVCTALTR